MVAALTENSENTVSEIKSILELRAMLDKCLETGTNDLNYEDTLAQIEHLGEAESRDGTEAAILVGYILKEDAKKTFNRLANYRKRCRTSGRIAHFDAFKMLCDEIIAPRVLTPHGFRITIGTENTDVLSEGILEIEKKMEAIGYEIFINSGTLLGVIRSGTFIPHDDDIDFGVVLHATDAASAAAEWIELKNTLEDMGLLKNVGWLGGILKTHKIGTCTVDFFPAWVEGNSVFVYPHTSGELVQADLLPLRRSDALNLPIPNNPEKMLAVNFGESWRIPDPLFKFSWGKQRTHFSEFLNLTKEIQS